MICLYHSAGSLIRGSMYNDRMDHSRWDQDDGENCSAALQPCVCRTAHMSVMLFPHFPAISLSEQVGRNKEYLDLVIRFVVDLVFDGFFVTLCPNSLKP